MKSIVLGMATVVILSSCTRTVYVTTPLTVPPEPELVKIQAEDLSCLSDEAYMKLVDRKLQRDKYESRMRAILESTQ